MTAACSTVTPHRRMLCALAEATWQVEKGGEVGDSWTDFVSADPWFRPEAARVDEALGYLRGELIVQGKYCSSGEISVRNEEAVSVFFSTEGGFQSRCPHCGAELTARELAEWMDEDHDGARGFRLAPRTMRCCGVETALTTLVYEPPQVYARFGVCVMNPEWKFRETLPSQRAVEEISYNPDWMQAEVDEWRARSKRWSADIRIGEWKIAARLESILGCGIVIVIEAD